MTERLPRLTAADVVRVLERLGFQTVRQSGSHRIFKDSVGKRVTVPIHSGRILHPKLLASIMRDADLSVERLRELLA